MEGGERRRLKSGDGTLYLYVKSGVGVIVIPAYLLIVIGNNSAAFLLQRISVQDQTEKKK